MQFFSKNFYQIFPATKTERLHARESQYSSFDVPFTQMQTVNIPVQNNASAGLIEFLVEFFRPNIVEDRQKFPNTSIANICT